jgi:hypothetical protein
MRERKDLTEALASSSRSELADAPVSGANDATPEIAASTALLSNGETIATVLISVHLTDRSWVLGAVENLTAAAFTNPFRTIESDWVDVELAPNPRASTVTFDLPVTRRADRRSAAPRTTVLFRFTVTLSYGHPADAGDTGPGADSGPDSIIGATVTTAVVPFLQTPFAR